MAPQSFTATYPHLSMAEKPQVDFDVLPLPRSSPKASQTGFFVPSSPMVPSPCSPIPSAAASAQHFALPTPSLHRDYLLPPRSVRLCSLVRPWLPLLAYLSTTLGFLLAVAFWRTELFAGLDELSSWLKNDRYGPAVMFALIFITTFPPLPLYSTLIVLSGYTFGTIYGAAIAYFAALAGAVIVFLLARHVLRTSIARWLASMRGVRRVVRAVERRPQLLFLIRLAPYPYNVMNCLLGASPTLTFRTYFICTALSLVKVMVHTSVGASIRSFAQYHAHGHAQTQADAEDTDAHSALGFYWTIGGIVLCVGIVMYLAIVARRAVDEELDGEEDDECGGPVRLPSHAPEETVSFLAAASAEEEDVEDRMVERARTPVSTAADPAHLV